MLRKVIDDGVKVGGKVVNEVGVAQWSLERIAPLPVSTGNETVVIKTREVLDQVEVKVQGNRSPFHTCVAEGLSEVPPFWVLNRKMATDG